MNPETVELIRFCVAQIRDAAVVIVPAFLTGYFALRSGKKDERIELLKLRSEHEFAVRNRFYEHLKEQQARVQTGHAELTSGIEKVLVEYYNGALKANLADIGNEPSEAGAPRFLALIQPLIDTFVYSLRSHSRAMRDERDSLLRFYLEHRSEDDVAAKNLQKLEFPEVDVSSSLSIERIREIAYQLIECNRVIANYAHAALHKDIEAQFEHYFTDGPKK